MILTREKRKNLSGICQDIGQVSLASILIEPLVNGKMGTPLIITGFILMLTSWYFSFKLIKD